MGDLMQRNMGNGAAVGDYNGDGYLGRAPARARPATTRGSSATSPGPGGGAPLHRRDRGGRARRRHLQCAGGPVRRPLRAAAGRTSSSRPTTCRAAPPARRRSCATTATARSRDVTAGSGFDPQGYIVGGMTFADYDGTRPPEHLPQLLDRGAGRRSRPRHADRGHVARATTGSTRTSATTTSRTSPTPAGSASTTPTASRRSSPTSPATACPTSTRPTTIGRTGSTATWAAAGSSTTRSSAGLDRAGNSMGVATAVGADGMLKLYITNITDPGGYFGTQPGQHVHDEQRRIATGIRFPTTPRGAGILDTAWGWGTAFVDMDGDGRPTCTRCRACASSSATAASTSSTRRVFLFLDDGTGRTFTPVDGHRLRRAGRPARPRGLRLQPRRRARPAHHARSNGPTILLENLIAGEALADRRPDRPGRRRRRTRAITVTAGRPLHDPDPARRRQLPRRAAARGVLRARRRPRWPTRSGSTGPNGKVTDLRRTSRPTRCYGPGRPERRPRRGVSSSGP